MDWAAPAKLWKTKRPICSGNSYSICAQTTLILKRPSSGSGYGTWIDTSSWTARLMFHLLNRPDRRFRPIAEDITLTAERILWPPLQRGRSRSQPRIPGCSRPADANLRALDRPPGVLVAAVSAQTAIRPIATPQAALKSRAAQAFRMTFPMARTWLPARWTALAPRQPRAYCD